MKATTEGTERYRRRFEPLIPPNHFNRIKGLLISSIGAGTYLGEMDEVTDRGYEASIARALSSGCNLVDTAINYRFQRSERNVSAALRKLIGEEVVSRDELVICTKGGFLSFDGDYPPNPARYIQEEYIQTGICSPEEIVAGCHCMSSRYLENQLERSLRN